MDFTLVAPAFVAGVLTFFAPCTLPLVPAYLAFISGVSLKDLQAPSRGTNARLKILLNGLLYVIGFSSIFILLGSLFGLGGAALTTYRIWLSRVGGIIIIFFGLSMLHMLKLPTWKFVPALRPGSPVSSLVFGATFALGWTPCVGPVVGTILLLASTTGTVGQGTFLLLIFSLGLAIPFLLAALGIGSATKHLGRFTKFLDVISVIGGVFLIGLGYLLLTNQFNRWLVYAYQLFDFLNYGQLLDYL